MPDARCGIDKPKLCAGCTVDEEVVIFMDRKIRVEASAFIDQAAMKQGGIRRHQGFVIEPDGKTGDATMPGQSTLGVVHLSA